MKKYGIILTLMVILVAFSNTNNELGIEENPKITSPAFYQQSL